jgi:hypothetical protein
MISWDVTGTVGRNKWVQNSVVILPSGPKCNSKIFQELVRGGNGGPPLDSVPVLRHIGIA